VRTHFRRTKVRDFIKMVRTFGPKDTYKRNDAVWVDRVAQHASFIVTEAQEAPYNVPMNDTPNFLGFALTGFSSAFLKTRTPTTAN
jgi:hypothetical protein